MQLDTSYFHHAKQRFVPTHDSYKGKCYSTKVSLINSYEEKSKIKRVNKSSGKNVYCLYTL